MNRLINCFDFPIVLIYPNSPPGKFNEYGKIILQTGEAVVWSGPETQLKTLGYIWNKSEFLINLGRPQGDVPDKNPKYLVLKY